MLLIVVIPTTVIVTDATDHCVFEVCMDGFESYNRIRKNVVLQSRAGRKCENSRAICYLLHQTFCLIWYQPSYTSNRAELSIIIW